MTTVDKHAPGTVCWVDLMTTDPGAARTFYGSLFDWSFDIGGPETMGYTLCRLGGKNVAGLGPMMPGASHPTVWTLYHAVTDADATVSRIEEAGGEVVMPPMDVMEHGRMAIVKEPTGGTFGLWQDKTHGGMRVIDDPGSLAWSELNTRDHDKAAAFFRTVFGHEVKPLGAPGMTYSTLHLGDKTVGGILQMDASWPAEVPPHFMIYFAVADTDASCAKIKELGGQVCVPPFDTPYGRIAVVNDPQGGTFSVVKQPAAKQT